jgi:hypothetical protein
MEDQMADCWQDWLDEADQWQPFFEQLTALQSRDVLATLLALSLINETEANVARHLKISSEGRSVALPIQQTVDDAALRLLAAAFVHAQPGQLVIPYLPLM